MDRQPTRILGTLAPKDLEDVGALIGTGVRLRDEGADLVDVDALRPACFGTADDDTIALLVRGLVELDIPVSVTTTSARRAAIALDHGARCVVDPSGGTADEDMRAVVARSTATCVLGPWRSPGARPIPEDPADAYTSGIIRNVAALLDAGVAPERIAVDSGAGLSATDPAPWRMLNHLERLAGLGYPVLVEGGDTILASMLVDEASEARLDDAAVALAALAGGLPAWAVRVDRVARASAALRRLAVPPGAQGRA